MAEALERTKKADALGAAVPRVPLCLSSVQRQLVQVKHPNSTIAKFLWSTQQGFFRIS